jgi:hypothetical protein
MQGAGSAVLRWFNLQSLTEVKSQLETMHLFFGVPRFFCSRDCKGLRLKSESRQVKDKSAIATGETKEAAVAGKSDAEVYASRSARQLPSTSALLDTHPATKRPLWHDILTAAGTVVASDASVSDHYAVVEKSWPDFLECMSWWQFKRYFHRVGPSVKYKTRADVTVVHPVGRFTTALTEAQWRDAC